MYSDEETELRDLIMQNLENCGFLSKIKAEIRAGVFLALEEDGNFKNKVPLFNQKFDDFVSTSEGKIILSLIREFLDYYNLHFTLSIFEPEVASPTPFVTRSELCDQLNVKSPESDAPVLVTLLKDVIKTENTAASRLSPIGSSSSPKLLKMTTNITPLQNETLDNLINESNKDQKDNLNNLQIHSSLSEANNEYSGNSFNVSNKLFIEDSNNVITSNVLKESNSSAEENDKINEYKKSSDSLPVEIHSFFDEPVPSEKSPFLKLSETSNDKSENKALTRNYKDVDSNKNDLTSLKDLPSLTANHEWTFSREAKNTLPSLDSLKSISSSEASNEEIINLDSKDNLKKKDINNAESNEDSSEKQNSEESIEEEIEEDSDLADLLNNSNSLSLQDDTTTDQTVSQVSVVEDADHIEPCK